MIGFQRTKILAQVEDIDLCVEMVESSNPAPNFAFLLVYFEMKKSGLGKIISVLPFSLII